MKSGSTLEKVLASGKPAVTAELGPPMSADPHEVIKKAQQLKGFCDAANITDCQTAVVRISSIAAAAIALQQGLEPVMQMTCRDRNRIAMQADLLGAAALGLKNCLCLAGRPSEIQRSGKAQGPSRRKERVRCRHLPACRHHEEDARREQAGRRRPDRSAAQVLYRRIAGRPWRTQSISGRSTS